MKPVFIIAPPRCRASLLVRLLTENASVRLIENPENREHFGRALSFRARTGWDAAVSTWSWVLNSWPEAQIIFLSRDQGEIEARMATSPQYQWIPKWGKCVGCCGGQVFRMLRSMSDFCDLNPSSAIIMESDDLLDYDKAFSFLDSIGISLPKETWEREIAVKSFPTKSPDAPVFDTDPATDPFHPLADLATVAKLPGSAVRESMDPFSENASWESLSSLPGPKRPDFLKIAEQEIQPLRMEASMDHVAIHPDSAIVHTIRFGDAPWVSMCAKTLDSWCSRHGYRLEVHGRGSEGLPSTKFILVRLMKEFLQSHHLRMIYIDGDVIIHPEAPGWPASLDGFCVRTDSPGKPGTQWERWKRKYRQKCPSDWSYRNAGIWSCDRESAEKFLSIVPDESEWVGGCQEQHQWNVWWAIAQEAGMLMQQLPTEWNRFAGSEPSIGWFYHLAGRDKNRRIRDLLSRRQIPRIGKSPKEETAKSSRAVAWMWSRKRSTWSELQYSMRSALENLESAPFHIFGDEQPAWLTDNAKVTFHLAPSYEEALSGALQCADEVVLMNDDIFILKPCRWDDLRTAMTRGNDTSLIRRMSFNMASKNPWLNGVADAVASLIHHGHKVIRDFSTHTPYLFERLKSIETMALYGVWRKMPFETLYHNHHGTERKSVRGLKAKDLPDDGDPWFLNHGNNLPPQATRDELEKRFPVPAPWEKQIVAKLSCGLGNQMFQIAAAAALAKASGLPWSASHNYHFDGKQGRSSTHYRGDILRLVPFNKGGFKSKPINEERFHFSQIILPEDRSSLEMNGWWQSGKHHDGIDVKQLFDLSWYDNKEVANLIGQFGKPLCAIHYRGGDFKRSKLRHICRRSYYAPIVERMRKTHAIILVTDDFEAASKDVDFFDHHFTSMTDSEDLAFMVSCDAIIIGNSTFAWWAAELGNHSEVHAPAKWFGNGSPIDCRDLPQQGWILHEIEGSPEKN